MFMKHWACAAVVACIGVTHGCTCDPLEPLGEVPEPPAPPPPPPGPEAFGIVEGRVCAPDGQTWLAQAAIFVNVPDGAAFGDDDADDDADRIGTVSDDEGRYRLENVPVGPQILLIEKGSFRGQREIVVNENLVTTIPDDACQLETAPRIVVVRGSEYDDVEGVLAELGVEAESIEVYEDDWAQQLLSTDSGLADVDILFLNCRSNEATFASRADMQERLRNFVAAGGSLHASDQAYDLIEIAFPDKINFLGADDERGAADQGESADVAARVLDGTLSASLGRDSIVIHYGLPTWSVMVSAEDDVYIYLEADAPLLDGSTLEDAPMIVGFDHGQGRVVYSSFHQEPGIGQDQENVLKLIMFEL